MIGFLSLVVLLYCIAMLFYAFRFKAFKVDKSEWKTPKTHFSIIIPFRNEAENLPRLLECLQQLKYPTSMFEILLVDDHSEDDSRFICKQFSTKHPHLNVTLLANKNLAKSPKKSAILSALKVVKNDYILTTDSDCLLPEHWLSQFDAHLQKNPVDLVAAPVKIIEDSEFWTKFQVLDMMSLQVIGLASFKTPSPLFCNAANLCYNTKTLTDIQAFGQHKDIISGDDVFTLEVFVKASKAVSVIVKEDVTVWTKAEPDFKSLTQQRLRWASKAKFYNNKVLQVLGVLVLLTNFGLILSAVAAFLTTDFRYFWWLWGFKLLADFYVLYVGYQFFKTNICFRDHLIMLFTYPFVACYFGLKSFRGNFVWKGRRYSQ